MKSLQDRGVALRDCNRRVPGWSKWLLAGLCLATFIYGAGNLSLNAARHDALENLAMGVHLSRWGGGSKAGYTRDPFVPIAIAAITFAQRELGFDSISPACVDRDSGRVESIECRAAYAPYKILNVVLVLIAGVGVFFLTHWFAEPRWLPHAAFLLVSQSLLGLWSFQTFYTGTAAAALLVVVACLSVLTAMQRRARDSAFLGLALAALALTKIVFSPFVLVVTAGLALADLVKGVFGRRTALLAGVMLLAWSVPVGGWIARNSILFGAFAVVQSDIPRVQRVFDLRASYNSMRDDEYAAGFWFYSPYRPGLGIPKSSWERFQTRTVDGFRMSVESAAYTDQTLPEIILADPLQHLKVSALMAWRGVFAQHRMGMRSISQSPLFHSRGLPRELSSSLRDIIWRYAHQPRNRKEAYVLWFRERGTIDAYGENEIREFLNLETVLEQADATLYRVPPPENFVVRGPRISEVLIPGSPSAIPWEEPGGVGFALREAPIGSIIFTNSRDRAPNRYATVRNLSEMWGLGSWPRWGWNLDPVTKTLVNLVGFLALLVAPLWFSIKHPGRFEVWLAALPAVYLHAVYSVASHFLPRYAQPEIPLRIWATLLLLCLFTALVHRAGSAALGVLLRRTPGRPG